MDRYSSTSLSFRTCCRDIVPRGVAVGLLCAGLSTHAAHAATPGLPAVELTVQIRVISETEWAAETAARETPHPPQQGLEIGSAVQAPLSARTQEIRVLNGRSAEVSWSQALPIQWLQAAQYRSRAGGGADGGIVNARTWLRVGQSLSVQPRWSGGRDPVQVDFRIETQDVDEPRADDIPASSTRSWASNLSVPWGQWTTFAATGTARPAPDSATWSTQSASAPGLQFMQLRVTRH